MKSILALGVLLILGHLNVFGQGSIEGYIMDSTLKKPIIGANAVLKNYLDTTIIERAVTDLNGLIIYRNLKNGKYKLSITSIGYDMATVNIRIYNRKSIIDTLFLKNKSTQLKEVIVKGMRPPMILKNDTLEYNTESYKTRAGSKTEDLLKKLPGITVNRESEVEARGKDVQSILVNGEKFFGNDLKKAIQNIPSNLIDKIQLYDSQSEESKYKGVDDGSRVTTINIITKKSVNTNYFGDLTGGFGTNNIYNLATNFNSLGRGLNYNVFGQTDNASLTGGNNDKFPSGTLPGISDIKNIGLNLFYSKPSKFKVNGSIQYSSSHNNLTQDRSIQNFLPEGHMQSNSSVANSENGTKGLLYNLHLEARIDSTTTFSMDGNFNSQNTELESVTHTIIKKDSILTGESLSKLRSKSAILAGYVNGYLSKHFKNKGRIVSLGFNFNINNTFQTDSILLQSIYNTGQVNQVSKNSLPQQSYGFTLNYTEPIQKHGVLRFNYSYSYGPGENRRKTMSFDTKTNLYDLEDSTSSQSKSLLIYQQPGINYTFQTSRLILNTGLSFQFESLQNTYLPLNPATTRYINIYPVLSTNYKFSNYKTLVFNYHGSINPPGITLLQPVINNSDPLNIRLGNADLKPTKTHSFSISYNEINPKTNQPFLLSLNSSIETNQIVDAISTLPSGAQISKPINFNGNYFISLNLTKGYSFKTGPRVNFNTAITYRQTGNLINNVVNFNRNISFQENLSLSNSFGENFDLTLNVQPSINFNEYSVSKTSSNVFNNNILLDATWYNDNWKITGYLTNLYYGKLLENSAKWFTFINIFLERRISKKAPLFGNFSIFNLLNNKTNVMRTFNENTIQQLNNNTVKPYCMVGLKWSLQ
ncbi:outer membrane beta-barrel protein [Pedobacter sp. L105]|uniref:outer membrane beta-barrel protein n=1 Tax=Pedobacter sp. L105 TaxID=1641871 RepID=UPI00131E7FFB|nr:outer membrane beta-barrel protein [Pedobacter sp. L105]